MMNCEYIKATGLPLNCFNMVLNKVTVVIEMFTSRGQ